MEAKHTLGPWTYEGDHTHRQYNIRMMGHMIGGHICTVNNLPTDVLANRDPSIAEANAALISAAPEMLAALEWAVDTADAEQYEAGWYADARMAIAKAKGRVK
jgi:hypothetical protein